MKNILAKLIAKPIVAKTNRWAKQPEFTQQIVFNNLLSRLKKTQFGKDNQLHLVHNYKEFKQAVAIQDYESLKPYIDQIVKGKQNVLWPGKPLYFAKTSGTTSGAKLIPISKESMPFHILSARNALLNYAYVSKNAQFFNGKMIFLQGSPNLQKTNGIATGRLSGIVANHVPKYLQTNKMPSHATNCITDWESKLQAIIQETKNADLRLISGIPPWLQMYFEQLIELMGNNIGEIFPNLSLLVTGGVNYSPYKNKIQELIGRPIDVIQTYPASEGFIAYQNSLENEHLLLLLNHGIFYEFIPSDEFYNQNPTRIGIEDVELNKDYVLILNTNAGLWAYNIGDTIRFVEKNPYKIVVTGRIKHFTSAFGEHVIAHEVETALEKTKKKIPCTIREFTVAPLVNPTDGKLPRHQWYIEFEQQPNHLADFASDLDQNLCNLNIYYQDLIVGKVLQPLQIVCVQKDGFLQYMKSVGKLGGQNKIPRLQNNRNIVKQLPTI